jgi:hypothetical protein
MRSAANGVPGATRADDRDRSYANAFGRKFFREHERKCANAGLADRQARASGPGYKAYPPPVNRMVPRPLVTIAGAAHRAAALMAAQARPGTVCVMPDGPSSPQSHAAVNSGSIPYFAGVEPETWALDPRGGSWPSRPGGTCGRRLRGREAPAPWP